MILYDRLVEVGSCKPRSRTVGMLEQILRIQIHDLWNAKMSGVVRNVGIIVDGTKRRPRGQLTHMEAGAHEEAGSGWAGAYFVTAEFTLVRPVGLPTQTR